MDIIKTGLPYQDSDFEKIQQYSANVDMSLLQFEQENKEKTALIYLRNTGYDVDLVFDNCSNEQKYKYLTEYVTNDFRLQDKQLANTWLKILNLFIGQETNIQGIISEQDCHRYIRQNLKLVQDVFIFCISVPLYLIQRYKITECTVSMDTVEKNKNYVPKAMYDLISADGYNLLFNSCYINPMYYETCFTDDNNELFEACKKCLFAKVLIGLSEVPTDVIEKNIINIEKEVEDYKNYSSDKVGITDLENVLDNMEV